MILLAFPLFLTLKMSSLWMLMWLYRHVATILGWRKVHLVCTTDRLELDTFKCFRKNLETFKWVWERCKLSSAWERVMQSAIFSWNHIKENSIKGKLLNSFQIMKKIEEPYQVIPLLKHRHLLVTRGIFVQMLDNILE